MSDPVCTRCPWTSKFPETNEVGAESTRQILLLVARMLHMNITDIECRHASLRRKIMRVQCKSIDVEDLSAQWIGQRCRRLHASFVDAGLKPTHSDGSTRAPSPPCKRTKATQGTASSSAPSAWRLFVAQETAGQDGSPDLAYVADRYRALSVEEKAAVVNAAAAKQGCRSRLTALVAVWARLICRRVFARLETLGGSTR